MRIVQVSDLHLSPRHAFFLKNWRRAAAHVAALKPDLVVVSGDLAINGPDDTQDLRFARSELDRLPMPWRALPGNHDTGDEPPGQDPDQIIDDARVAAWRASFGPDWWREQGPGGWRILGLNSQLFGSGLAAEAEQWAFLEAELAAATGPVGVFMHKPLLVEDPTEPASPRCIVTGPRERLTQTFADGAVRFLATGHLHCFRHVEAPDFDRVWAPATSFIFDTTGAQSETARLSGVKVAPGCVVHDLTEDGWTARFEPVPTLESLTLEDIKQGRYAFLRDMPAFFPEDVEV